MRDDLGSSIADPPPPSIESRASWIAAGVTLAILSVAYGSTLLIVVGLRAMELDLGVSRSILALAGALTWIGTGLGGIIMGWLADRIGIRNSVLILLCHKTILRVSRWQHGQRGRVLAMARAIATRTDVIEVGT